MGIFVIDKELQQQGKTVVFELVRMNDDECVIKSGNYGFCSQKKENLISVRESETHGRGNKIIASRRDLLHCLEQVLLRALEYPVELSLKMNYPNPKDFIIKKNYTSGVLTFGDDIESLNCEASNSFKCNLYKEPMFRLIRVLSVAEEQPVTLSFEDSETFNIKICELFI